MLQSSLNSISKTDSRHADSTINNYIINTDTSVEVWTPSLDPKGPISWHERLLSGELPCPSGQDVHRLQPLAMHPQGGDVDHAGVDGHRPPGARGLLSGRRNKLGASSSPLAATHKVCLAGSQGGKTGRRWGWAYMQARQLASVASSPRPDARPGCH